MGLFKPDLYRNFAIGFLVGAAAVIWSAAPEWEAEFAGKAYAAEVDTDSERVTRTP